jgi:hypothetical protein
VSWRLLWPPLNTQKANVVRRRVTNSAPQLIRSDVQGCGAVSLGWYFQTFRRLRMPSSSGQASHQSRYDALTHSHSANSQNSWIFSKPNTTVTTLHDLKTSLTFITNNNCKTLSHFYVSADVCFTFITNINCKTLSHFYVSADVWFTSL